MKKFSYLIQCFVFLACISFPASIAHAENPNLIANASVENASTNTPANWTTNNWGSNTPSFTYSQNGHTGSRSLSVTVTNHSSGDAKWMPSQVGVTPGETYIYSDWSKSSAVTELDLAYTDSSGNMSFVYLKTIPASTSWQQISAEFTVPANTVSVSVYHIIYSNGTLQTDDFSLIQVSEPTPEPPANPSNLISNPSFETATNSMPASWQTNKWGTNTANFTYVQDDANSGSKSAKVTVSSYQSGDAKWYASPVNVNQGATYKYADYYKSNVPSRVVLAIFNTNGSVNYTELPAVPLSNTWATYSTTFVAPAGVQSVSLYHILDKVGTLSIDDVSLTLLSTGPPPETPNPIVNPSFEASSGTSPTGWQPDKWGTNTAAFAYVQDDAHTGSRSSKVTISNYVSGDAKWIFSPITDLVQGSQYSFSAWYKTNTQARVVAAYVDNQGLNHYLTLPNPLGGGNSSAVWQEYKTTLDIPQNAVSMSVYFLISSNGWLQTDDFSLTEYQPDGFNEAMISLTFDDGWSSIYTNGLPILQKYGFVSTQYLTTSYLNTPGYMTTSMARTFHNSGHEIASHTVTHPNLTALSSNQLTSELSNSQTTLRQLFGTNVAKSIASPYGLYNSTTLVSIRQYYQSHRSTDVGFNTKDDFNPYNIKVQNIKTDTTPAEVAAWVAKAKTEKSWLVLVYHPVINSNDPDDYAVSPANLDQELSNIKTSGIAVKTVSQALDIIQAQL